VGATKYSSGCSSYVQGEYHFSMVAGEKEYSGEF
jgi:hypothetical protein